MVDNSTVRLLSKGVDDINGVRLPTPVGITLHVHTMSSSVDVEVGPSRLQQGVPIEVGIGFTAVEARLMAVVVFKTATAYIPSRSTAG